MKKNTKNLIGNLFLVFFSLLFLFRQRDNKENGLPMETIDYILSISVLIILLGSLIISIHLILDIIYDEESPKSDEKTKIVTELNEEEIDRIIEESVSEDNFKKVLKYQKIKYSKNL